MSGHQVAARPPADALSGPLEVRFPPVPAGARGWCMAGVTDIVVLLRMPDGTCSWGRGATREAAEADACRNWERHKRALAAGRREYRRRAKSRARRRR